MDTLGASGNRGQYHIGRGDREIVPMVFADAYEVDADLIGENAFLDNVAQDLGLRQQLAALVHCHVAERVQSHLDHSGGILWHGVHFSDWVFLRVILGDFLRDT